MRIAPLALAATLAVLLLAAPAHAQNEVKIQAATEAAKAWLALIDAGDYETSWEEASGYFRSAVGKQEWIKTMQAYRKPLGELLERSLLVADYTTQPPGAPDGEYVIIHFNATFENKEVAQEVVTPMLQENGAWRISGYYIR
jgi:hypothetical protein